MEKIVENYPDVGRATNVGDVVLGARRLHEEKVEREFDILEAAKFVQKLVEKVGVTRLRERLAFEQVIVVNVRHIFRFTDDSDPEARVEA